MTLKVFTYSLVSQYVKELFPTENYEVRTERYDYPKATPNAQVGIVENIGVEPMTSCMPCKRSSQLS